MNISQMDKCGICGRRETFFMWNSAHKCYACTDCTIKADSRKHDRKQQLIAAFGVSHETIIRHNQHGEFIGAKP